MYTYAEIKDSLSVSTVSILAEANIYNVYQAGAESIILSEKGDIERSSTPVQAFVWIIEYLVINKITNISEEKAKYYYDNYKYAIEMLKQKKQKQPLTGRINDMYEA